MIKYCSTNACTDDNTVERAGIVMTVTLGTTYLTLRIELRLKGKGTYSFPCEIHKAAYSYDK